MIGSNGLRQIANRNTGRPVSRVAARGRSGRRSSAGDTSQARLISDLAGRFALDADRISAVVALIGQVRAVRKMLRALLATTTRLPPPLRERLHAELTERHNIARHP